MRILTFPDLTTLEGALTRGACDCKTGCEGKSIYSCKLKRAQSWLRDYQRRQEKAPPPPQVPDGTE